MTITAKRKKYIADYNRKNYAKLYFTIKEDLKNELDEIKIKENLKNRTDLLKYFISLYKENNH